MQALSKTGLNGAGMLLMGQGLLFVNMDHKMQEGMLLIILGVVVLLIKEFLKHYWPDKNKEEVLPPQIVE